MDGRHVIITIIELRHVSKCCPKGFRLNSAFTDCESIPDWRGHDVPEEMVDPISQNVSWLPRTLSQSRIVVLYRKRPLFHWNVFVDALADITHVTATDNTSKLEETFAWRLQEDGNGYNVWVRGNTSNGANIQGTAKDFCFDAAADGPFPGNVVLARIWTINKCCRREEYLNTRTLNCISERKSATKDLDFERLDGIDATVTLSWLPTALSQKPFLVNYLRESDRWWFSKSRTLRADDTNLWRIEFSALEEPKLVILSTDQSGDAVSSRAWLFCFDETKDAPLAPRVLLTVSSEVNKCCHGGYQLDVRATKCVPHPEMRKDDAEFGIVDPVNDPSQAYWLPRQLRTRLIPVRFNIGVMEKGGVVFRADHVGRWKLEFSQNRAPTLSIFTYTLLGSNVATIPSDYFCFDKVDNGPVVLVADVCFLPGFNCFFKCCPLGEYLSSDMVCVPNNAEDWSLNTSIANKYLQDEGLYGVKTLSNPMCRTAPFSVQETPQDAREFAERLEAKWFKYRFSKTFSCVDLRRTSAGPRETLAYCVAPPIAPTYERVRPLTALAVALLVAALAAILGPRETRASTHGRSLACHAACLLAANALQALWFFFDKDDAYCTLCAYGIYFFLVAAGFWLNAISINIARGFSRPLAAASAAGGSRQGWRAFALLSTYAWGCSAALTAICIQMHRNERVYKERGFVTPSFFETRTCFFEAVHTEEFRRGRPSKPSNALGALLYYYAPMGVLAAANTLCLLLTTRQIRALKRNTSMLQRPGASSSPAPRGLGSALLYAKLLLTAGAVELLLEAVAWGARGRYQGSEDWADDFAAHRAFVFAIAATFIDVARAAAVLWLCAGKWRVADAARRCLRRGAGRRGPWRWPWRWPWQWPWRWRWRRRVAPADAAASSSSADLAPAATSSSQCTTSL